jgi:monofunctional biosynthetic peptidoglycan transglycosylase
VASRRRNYRIAGAAVVTVLAAAAALAWWRRSQVDLSAWRSGPPPATWAARARQDAKWQAEGSRRRVEHEFVALDGISVELQLAVLVSEDIGYFGHGALDLRAIWEAVDEWRRGGRLRGASTITQQLARSLFLSPERSLWRKVAEVRLAGQLERDLGKRRVLELYLNVVEFGPGLLGAEAAARRYCAAPARDLTAVQAAGLAAAVPSPGRDNPATGSHRWAFRRDLILRRMERAAWLRRQLESL